MVDFSKYQGPSEEWQAYVGKNPLPPVDVQSSPIAIRSKTNAMRVLTSQNELQADGLRNDTYWIDHSILTRDNQSIIIRTYHPKKTLTATLLPVYLYFHGGGHLLGTVETEDASCSRLAARAGIIVASVNCRHTPEFRHPTQVNDAWDSFEWLSTNGEKFGADTSRIIVGGISAGAGLAASIIAKHYALISHDDKVPKPKVNVCGQLLCIPWLIHPDNHPFSKEAISSFQQNVDAPVLPFPLLRLFTDLLGAEDPKDPTLNVALLEDQKISDLPKASFLVAGQDMLRDEGLLWAERLKNHGVPTKVHLFPGLPHGFRRFSDLPASKRWDDLLVESCEWILSSSDTASSFQTV